MTASSRPVSQLTIGTCSSAASRSISAMTSERGPERPDRYSETCSALITDAMLSRLGADERVKRRHRLATRNLDLPLVRARPMNAEKIQVLAEDCLDVR